jgi:hypothetical protein
MADDRPQWMISAVEELWSDACADMWRSDLDVIARHYAAEAERVQELRTAAEKACRVIELSDLGQASYSDGQRLRKALAAWK